MMGSMSEIYDDPEFFKKYAAMPRSVQGLSAAGEWPVFRGLLPSLVGSRVLDLGCGYGWHCRYAAEQGAVKVVGVDSSQRMLDEARKLTDAADSSAAAGRISYVRDDVAAYADAADPASFDVVVSSLVLHYLRDLAPIMRSIYAALDASGTLLFTIEHPIFTAEGSEQWVVAADGSLDHWPLDRYFDEGERTTEFLGSSVTKYHHTFEGILGSVLGAGFVLDAVREPQPPEELRDLPEMQPSTRVPMMLIVKAHKA